MQSFSQTASGVHRSVRNGAIVAAGALLLVVGSSVGAHAQTYVGSAYGLDAIVLGVLGVQTGGVTLPGTGSATPVTSTLASATLDTSLTSAIVGLLAQPTTGVMVTSTQGSGGSIDSKAVTNGLNAPIANLTVAFVNITEGLYADTVTSETTASGFSSATLSGTSTFENLHFTNALGQTVAIGATSNYQPAANTILTNIPGVASVTLNEQVWNSNNTVLTTNAIDVATLIGTHVIVASSTAGFIPGGTAAAPEPGSISLLSSLALPGLLGAVGVYRRRRGAGANEAQVQDESAA